MSRLTNRSRSAGALALAVALGMVASQTASWPRTRRAQAPLPGTLTIAYVQTGPFDYTSGASRRPDAAPHLGVEMLVLTPI